MTTVTVSGILYLRSLSLVLRQQFVMRTLSKSSKLSSLAFQFLSSFFLSSAIFLFLYTVNMSCFSTQTHYVTVVRLFHINTLSSKKSLRFVFIRALSIRTHIHSRLRTSLRTNLLLVKHTDNYNKSSRRKLRKNSRLHF